MTTRIIREYVIWLINHCDTEPIFNRNRLCESLDSVLDKSDKYEDIRHILELTDFENKVSLNAFGEDFGYKESILEIANICGVEWED